MALTNEDKSLIMICLRNSMNHSKPFLPESVIEENIQKLLNYEHHKKNGSFGNYYLIHKVRFVQLLVLIIHFLHLNYVYKYRFAYKILFKLV